MFQKLKVALAASGLAVLLAGNASAADVNASVFGGLSDTAPRSVFDQIGGSAPRSPFDQLADSAPRTIFDDLKESAPRSTSVFGTLGSSAP
jgi:opacity protein-like surface antigen